MKDVLVLSKFERWWLGWWPHRLHIRYYVPKFLRLCPEAFRGEVLEIGAGHGWTSRRILDTFPQVELTAIDSDLSATQSFTSLEKKYGQRLTVRQANAEELPFDRNAFDIVIAVHTMHHVRDAAVVIQQMLRVLRPGGLLGIADEDQRSVVGSLQWLWRKENQHNREHIAALLAAEVKVLVNQGAKHYCLWARKPYPNDEQSGSKLL